MGIGYSRFDVNKAKKNLHTGSDVTILVDNSGKWEDAINRGSNLIRFYSLKSEGEYYLKLEDYNKGRQGNRWGILLVWLVATAGYIYDLWIKPNKSK